MKVAIAFAVLVAILTSGCGSDDSVAPPAPTSAGSEELSSEDVEKAFLAEAAGGGVVNHDGSPPKSIECEKGDATRSGAAGSPCPEATAASASSRSTRRPGR